MLLITFFFTSCEDPNKTEVYIPKIAVCGVGGAGGNAVDTMLQNKLTGVEYVVCNTDQQVLR